jgi:uncharacterized protein (DUF488 family)
MGNQPWVASVGYEGETPEALVDQLTGWAVKVLVDVRLNPISRKRGFSKAAWSALLGQHGIEYVHCPALGNPRDNREGFADLETKAGAEARDRFNRRLQDDTVRDVLDGLANLASQKQIALMCFERSELHCHRHEVLREVYSRLEAPVAV